MEIVKSFSKPKDKNGNNAVDLPQMMLELQRYHEQECSISPGAYQLMVTLFLAFNEHLMRIGKNKEKTVWNKAVLQLTNAQLLNRLKWKSEKSLIDNRKELVQAGILLYEPGKAKSKGSLYRIRFKDTDVNALKKEVQENRPLYKNGRVVSTVKNTPINGSTTVINFNENPLTTAINEVVSTAINTPITTVKNTPPSIDSIHKNESYYRKENKDIIRELKKKENVLENRAHDLQPTRAEFQLKYRDTVSNEPEPMGEYIQKYMNNFLIKIPLNKLEVGDICWRTKDKECYLKVLVKTLDRHGQLVMRIEDQNDGISWYCNKEINIPVFAPPQN